MFTLLSAVDWSWRAIGLLKTLGIVVILPIVITCVIVAYRRYEIDKRTSVMLAIIDKGGSIDPEVLALFGPTRVRSEKKALLIRFFLGCAILLLGVAFIVVTIVGLCFDSSRDMPADGFFWFTFVLGSVLLALGAALVIYYIVGRRVLAPEIEIQEKSLK